jgi:hypothetical protein
MKQTPKLNSDNSDYTHHIYSIGYVIVTTSQGQESIINVRACNKKSNTSTIKKPLDYSINKLIVKSNNTNTTSINMMQNGVSHTTTNFPIEISSKKQNSDIQCHPLRTDSTNLQSGLLPHSADSNRYGVYTTRNIIDFGQVNSGVLCKKKISICNSTMEEVCYTYAIIILYTFTNT